jgi:hypothetical protein
VKRARPYARTGLNALKARVKIRGLHAIDQRTAAAQALTTWRAEIIADLGGEAGLSTAKRTLVDLAVRTRLFIDHLDGWLLEQASLVNARRRVVLPVLRDRAQFADARPRPAARTDCPDGGCGARRCGVSVALWVWSARTNAGPYADRVVGFPLARQEYTHDHLNSGDGAPR